MASWRSNHQQPHPTGQRLGRTAGQTNATVINLDEPPQPAVDRRAALEQHRRGADTIRWPPRSATDASQTSSRMPPLGAGPTSLARTSSSWTLTTHSLPVSRRSGNQTLSRSHNDRPPDGLTEANQTPDRLGVSDRRTGSWRRSCIAAIDCGRSRTDMDRVQHRRLRLRI